MTEEMKEKYWSRFQATFDENQEYVVGKDFLDDVKENIKKFHTLLHEEINNIAPYTYRFISELIALHRIGQFRINVQQPSRRQPDLKPAGGAQKR